MLVNLIKRAIARKCRITKEVINRACETCLIDTLEDRRLMSSSLNLGMNLNNVSSSTYPQLVSMLKDTGQRSVRLWAGFSSYDSRSLNGVLKFAPQFKADGFDVMVSLVPNNGIVGSYSQVTGMVDWLMNVPGLKESVDRWQIGNEPEYPKYWNASLNDYVNKFLKPAAEVLHNYGEKVVSAGPSWNPEDIRTMVKAGMLNYTDYVGYHPYRSTLPDLQNMVAQVKELAAGKPLVASEWNVRGHEGDVDPKYWAADIPKFFDVISQNFYAAYYFVAFTTSTKAGRAGVIKPGGAHNEPFYSAVKSLSNGFNGTDPTDTGGGGNTGSGNTGSIRGYTFADANSNGIFDAGETVGASTVFIDANANGTLDTGEKQTTSDANGLYSFTGLSSGSYKISRVLPTGYHLSNSASGYITIALAPAQIILNANLGAALDASTGGGTGTTGNNGSISGQIFGDLNNNGIMDAGETGGARVVFIDTNANGKLDVGEKQTLSDAVGLYSFTGLSAGAYNLSRVFPAGYRLSNNSSGYVAVTLATDQALTGINLGSTNAATGGSTGGGTGGTGGGTTTGTTGSIAGLLFNDKNLNGIKDGTDSAPTPRAVYIDANNNNQLDAGEKSVLSDLAGKYLFGGLSAGTYTIRRVMPSGYKLTTPAAGFYLINLAAGQNLTNINFGSAPIV